MLTKRLKPIFQFSATECGVAALAMLLAYYGKYVSMEALRERCGAGRDGTSMMKLIEIAESYGMTAHAYRAELSDIKKLGAPVIAYWRFQHYVVITRVSNNRVYMNDPAQGAISVTHAEFDKYFTGVLLHLLPDINFEKTKPPAIILPMLFSLIRQNPLALSFLVVLLVFSTLIPIANSKINSIFVDFCLLAKNMNWLLPIMMVTLVLTGVTLLTLYLQKSIQFRFILKSGLIQVTGMMQHVLQLPLLFFSLRQKPEITALLMRSEMVLHALYDGLANSFAGIILTVMTFAGLVCIDKQLALILLAEIGLLILVSRWVTKCNLDHEQANIQEMGKYYSFTLSSMNALVTIKTGGMESIVLKRWLSALYGKLSAADKSAYIQIILDNSAQIFNQTAMLITFGIGSLKVASGMMTVGGLLAFYGLQTCLTTQILTVMHTIISLQHGLLNLTRIKDLMDYPPDKPYINQQDQSGDELIMKCRDIAFAYSPFALPVVSEINLSINRYQHIAFIGETGSGKSTLAKLLSQLYSATSGSMTGFNQSKTAYVSQEINLFTGTIYENLTMWREDIEPAIIDKALQDVCLSSLIAKRGINSRVEENGRNFSGGEKQRLDIARALIQLPDLLILDEATSALDQTTEAAVIANLRRRPMTIIFVAHRLTSIKHCDQLFVMKNGKIIERGHHADLMAKQAYYYELIKKEEAYNDIFSSPIITRAS